MPELTDKQIVRRLRSLERGWPNGKGLYAMNGTLVLVDYHHERDILPTDVIETFSGIMCDGGDW